MEVIGDPTSFNLASNAGQTFRCARLFCFPASLIRSPEALRIPALISAAIGRYLSWRPNPLLGDIA